MDSRLGKPLAGVAAVLSLALAACSTPQAAPPAAPAGPDTAAAAQPKVNRLVLVVPIPQRTELQIRHMPENSSWILRPMHDFPVNVNSATGKLEAGIATEWAWEPDGKGVRVKLRPNIPFHNDGGVVTSADIKFAWEQLVQKDSLHGQAPYWRDNVTGVDVVSPTEFVYRLKGPDGNFVTAMSEEQGGAEIQSKASFDKNGPASYATGPYNGSGPFRYIAGAADQYVRFQKAPYQHWRANAVFPEFEFRFVKEASTRMAALIAGEVQMASLPTDLQNQAEKQGMKTMAGKFPGVRVFGGFYCCYLNDPSDVSKGYKFPDSPYMDLRVRQAINKAMNRDEINKSLYGGKGQLMYVNHMNQSRQGWNPQWEKDFQSTYGYDPAGAKKLLADAGQSNLKTTVFVAPTTGIAGGEDLAEAAAGYLRAVGIQVDLQSIDLTEQSNRQRTFAYSNHIAFASTGSNSWTGWTTRNSSLGTRGGGVEDPDIDRVLRQLVVTTDEKRREELWRQVGDTAFAKAISINLFWLPYEISVNPKIVGAWEFPGTLSGGYTHVWNIKPAS